MHAFQGDHSKQNRENKILPNHLRLNIKRELIKQESLMELGVPLYACELVGRYFFESLTIWAHGFPQRIFGSYFFIVGVYTLLKDGHAQVDIIYQRFSLKKRAFFDLVNYTLLLIWYFVLMLVTKRLLIFNAVACRLPNCRINYY